MSRVARSAVLVVTDVYPPVSGGSGWSTHALVQMLTVRGHRVVLMEVDPTADDDGERAFGGVAVLTIGVAGARRSLRRRLGADDYATERVRQAVAQQLRSDSALDVVHGQHLHSAPGAMRAAREEGRGGVVTLRDYWPVCLHGTSWWNDRQCPGCSTQQLTGCMKEVFGLPTPAATALVPWANRRIAARTRAVARARRAIAVSRAVRDLLVARAPELSLSVVPNVVDMERNAAAAARAAPPDVPDGYLLAAGKLSVAKGFERLVDELADAGCTRPVVIAGDGPLAAHLSERAAARGIDLQLCGWIGGDDLLRLTRDAAAVLLPSAWAEPLSRVLLESLSLGTPVVAWNTGGSAEAIEDGVNGWLIDGADSLAAAIQELDDPERLRVAGEAAARTAATRFSPDAVYPRIVEQYRAAADQVGRRFESAP